MSSPQPVPSQKRAQLITGLATAAAVVRPYVVWDDLPPVLASHFAADGTPNGMSGKSEFFWSFGLIMGFVLLSLVGSIALIEHIPAKYINLPHKDYWLTSGHMPEARRKVSTGMWWMCAATMLLTAGVLELTLQANVERRNLNGTWMWIFLGGYFVFTLVWLVQMLTGFTPPQKNRT